ncbi:MAG: STAS domain-containing protein [Burkholderiales bacterium]|jgi:phospholipid transport system transporter-binding protein|nr:STAS domain-containing protein [Burkholderiales bacterium]PKO45523.1 MAG: anti-anti-sigma factor [Betaproteobacteria bacterium HGW-Betaproteobacteria-3]
MLVLPAELTQHQANACLRMLLQALRQVRESVVVADATALKSFDSAVLAVLLECRREAMAMGKSFAVRGLPTRLRELAVLYGVAELLAAAP